MLDNRPPWTQGQPLQVYRLGPDLPNFQVRAHLASDPVSWSATAGAVLVFLAEAAHAAERGSLWLVLLVGVAAAIWLALAQQYNLRPVSVPLAMLLTLQLVGAGYYLSSFRTPARRLNTPFTAFDFHTHTTRSNGLLTPQQQIDWHRARGFKGLAFTDSNLLMPEAELNALRRANPDMLLLNGCEYHGEAHLILLGIRRSISARRLGLEDALKEAKRQNAIVIVAHPWSSPHISFKQWQEFGVDGFEIWNGGLWQPDLIPRVKQQRLAATASTDTLSKSGSHCYVWSILPRGMDDPDDVLRALRMRKLAAAAALGRDDNPASYEPKRLSLRTPLVLFMASSAAWRSLTGAQKLCTLLGMAALACLGSVLAMGYKRQAVPVVAGPTRAVSFLRRRRLVMRLIGLMLMLWAFLGSILAAVITMGPPRDAAWLASLSLLSPMYAIFAWVVLDGLYLYGRMLWNRTQ